MSKDTVVQLRQPEGQDLLSTMLREGGFEWLPKVVEGVQFRDGIEVKNEMHVKQK